MQNLRHTFSKLTTRLSPLLLLLTLCMACTQSPDLKKQTEEFYQAMQAHDHAKIVSFYSDSVRVIGNGYRSVYSKAAYKDWVEWDAAFAPSYEILSLIEGEGYVEAKVRKSDPRILFLNGEPFITKERLNFVDDKIQSLEIIEEQYNEARWIETRAAFVNWITENHPELDGFIFDQTKRGGENYERAIELYQKAR